jgi:hypothetical protein
MKKTHIKELKQLAEKLPKSFDLEPTRIGNQIKHKLVEINHFNRLKNAFARNKEQGLIDYIKWVKINNNRMNEIFSKLQPVNDNNS